MNERMTYRQLREIELEAAKKKREDLKLNEVNWIKISNKSYWFGQGCMYDSSLNDQGRNFNNEFYRVLPKGEYQNIPLKRYVEDSFSLRKGDVIGLELGGPGSKLFGGFHPDLFRQTAGVCLTDSRNDTEKKDDERGRHTLIAGDLLEQKTKDAIAQWRGGRKIDFIIERMAAGHEYFPRDAFFMAKESSYWYSLLAEKGIFLIEIPRAFKDNLKPYTNYLSEWVSLIKRDYEGRLEIASGNDCIRLHKLDNAPKELPLLRARDIIEREKARLLKRATTPV